MRRLLRNSVVSTVVATAATTAALVWLGRREGKSGSAPLNAVSHIAWGDEAFEHDGPDVKHTPVGLLLNAFGMLTWAAVHEGLFGWRRRAKPIEGLVTGAAVAGLAYAVDYHAVPERLNPGIEQKLSSKAMFGVYAAMAAALALGAMLRANPKPCADDVDGSES